jgi:hypothetical protein
VLSPELVGIIASNVTYTGLSFVVGILSPQILYDFKQECLLYALARKNRNVSDAAGRRLRNAG